MKVLNRKTAVLFFALALGQLSLKDGSNARLGQAQAKGGGRPPSTTPACPLKCQEGYTVSAYSWAIHPERTNYDAEGKVQVPPDAVWIVSCALRCEQHAINQPTKVTNEKKDNMCSSGGEPSPYTGPWRITGQFTRECAARQNNGCGLHCYAVRPKKPAGKAGTGSKTGRK